MKSIDLLSKACEPSTPSGASAADTSQITDTVINKIADAVIAKLSSTQQDPIDKADENEAETEQPEHAQEQTAEPEAAAAESSEEGEET